MVPPEDRQPPATTNAIANQKVEIVNSLPPAFSGGLHLTDGEFRVVMQNAVRAWLHRTPSLQTRRHYAGDLRQFLDFIGIDLNEAERLARILPDDVARWRDHRRSAGLRRPRGPAHDADVYKE